MWGRLFALAAISLGNDTLSVLLSVFLSVFLSVLLSGGVCRKVSI